MTSRPVADILADKIACLHELLDGLADDRTLTDPLDVVQALRMIRDTADSALWGEAVPLARHSGASLDAIGRMAGVSRQAVHARAHA